MGYSFNIALFLISVIFILKRFCFSEGLVNKEPIQYLLKPKGRTRKRRSTCNTGEGTLPSRFSSMITRLPVPSLHPVS